MKPFSFRNTALSLFVMSAATSLAHAAPTAKTPSKAPVTKKPTAAQKPKLIREVMGTEQLVGYEGALGQIFTVGKETAINFTLRSAAYSAGRVNVGQYAQFTGSEEKLLVLHFTLHNPQKTVFNYTDSCLTFKAVDATGVTRPGITNLAREVTGEQVSAPLQPGQKIEVYTVIRVAAYGEVPKLIVQNRYDTKAPIVRYDLRGKVTKLGAPYGDPADAKGATARKVVPAKIATSYPVAEALDVRVESVTYSDQPLNGSEPREGKRYCVALATLQNRSPKPAAYSAAYFIAELKDADGEKVVYNARLRKAARDEESSNTLAPGETARVRFYWELPTDVAAKKVLLRDGFAKEARVYAIEIPDTQ